ncbi:MAG: hypothetical protein HZB57_11480 [Gammaproteobacteria bacterium]|nr:hypothetical protein [Gammaproteobacteria bacterium]
MVAFRGLCSGLRKKPRQGFADSTLVCVGFDPENFDQYTSGDCLIAADGFYEWRKLGPDIIWVRANKRFLLVGAG